MIDGRELLHTGYSFRWEHQNLYRSLYDQSPIDHRSGYIFVGHELVELS